MTYRSNITDKDRFIDICDLTTKLVGLRKGALSYKTRKERIHLPRMVAANIGRLEGIHWNTIAEVLNRDRASIYHYENNHSGNYASWSDYRDTFNLVYKVLGDIKGSKGDFDCMFKLKRHILEYTKEYEPYQTNLVVKSGEVSCVIRTSYSKFSDVLKNVKFALTNYNHTISIKV